MDLIMIALALTIGITLMAVVAAGFGAATCDGLGAIVRGRDDQSWWRATLPWPQGVQEDDEVRWRFAPRGAADEERDADGSERPPPGHARPIPPTRPQARVSMRWAETGMRRDS